MNITMKVESKPKENFIVIQMILKGYGNNFVTQYIFQTF